MKKIDKGALMQALQMLGLDGKTSLREIRAAYKRMMNEWHPDKRRKDEDTCLEMTKKISHAYALLVEYCEDVLIEFSDQGIKSATTEASVEEFWNERFGKDPLWGG